MIQLIILFIISTLTFKVSNIDYKQFNILGYIKHYEGMKNVLQVKYDRMSWYNLADYNTS